MVADVMFVIVMHLTRIVKEAISRMEVRFMNGNPAREKSARTLSITNKLFLPVNGLAMCGSSVVDW